jgi:hypothetical protein
MDKWATVDVPTHPIGCGRWVDTIVRIRNNATGEIREWRMNQVMIDGDDYPNTFIWKDGDFSCDCNRSVFFAQSIDGDDKYTDECGNGAYAVQLLNAVDREVYYSEFSKQYRQHRSLGWGDDKD